MKIPRVAGYVIAGVLALLLIVWLGSKCTTSRTNYERDRAAWDVERKRLQREIAAQQQTNTHLIARIHADSAAAAPIIRQTDSLLVIVERERAAKADALRRLAERQRELADTTEMSRIAAEAIAAAQDARAEADTLRRAAVSLRSVVDRQLQSIAALTGSLQETQARADSCAAVLDRAPVYKGDKLLGFIPLPSRTASLVIGGVVGAAATYAIVNR